MVARLLVSACFLFAALFLPSTRLSVGVLRCIVCGGRRCENVVAVISSFPPVVVPVFLLLQGVAVVAKRAAGTAAPSSSFVVCSRNRDCGRIRRRAIRLVAAGCGSSSSSSSSRVHCSSARSASSTGGTSTLRGSAEDYGGRATTMAAAPAANNNEDAGGDDDEPLPFPTSFPLVHPTFARILSLSRSAGENDGDGVDGNSNNNESNPCHYYRVTFAAESRLPTIELVNGTGSSGGGGASSSTAVVIAQRGETATAAAAAAKPGGPQEEFPVESLVPLAVACDRALFGNGSSGGNCNGDTTAGGDPGRGHIEKGSDNDPPQAGGSEATTTVRNGCLNTVGVLAELCLLESTLYRLSIGCCAGGGISGGATTSASAPSSSSAVGRAPLLKDILQRLSSEGRHPLAPVLRALLLPTGLNLRNLVWHGFVGRLPRPWLSLVVVLSNQLDREFLELEHVQHREEQLCRKEGGDTEQRQQKLEPLVPELKKVASQGRALLEEWQRKMRSCGAGPHSKSADAEPSFSAIPEWLPTSDHVALWELSLEWLTTAAAAAAADDSLDDERNNVNSPAATACAAWMVLAESGLRRQWCRLNRRTSRDSVAQPNAMYVTLDGHGQRHKHNLLLQPYLTVNGDGDGDGGDDYDDYDDYDCAGLSASTGTGAAASEEDESGLQTRKNALVDVMGGSCHALWSDLFVSPFGPNLRAAVAHGSWNAYLENDLGPKILKRKQACATTPEEHAIIFDYACVLLVAMEAAAANTSPHRHQTPSLITKTYRPLFSFTAKTVDSLERLRDQLEQLGQRVSPKAEGKSTFLQPPALVDSLTLPDGLLSSCMERLLLELQGPAFCQNVPNTDQIDNHDSVVHWTTECVYHEHEANRHLAPLGAARRLLDDIVQATKDLAERLDSAAEALSRMDDNDDNEGGDDGYNSRPTSRQQRRLIRQIESAPVARTFYSFATLVALLCLLNDAASVLDPSSGENGKDPAKDLPSKRDLLKACERTRMVVSTVQTYLTMNAERAYKAINDYTKGKAVKKIIATTTTDASH